MSHPSMYNQLFGAPAAIQLGLSGKQKQSEQTIKTQLRPALLCQMYGLHARKESVIGRSFTIKTQRKQEVGLWVP